MTRTDIYKASKSIFPSLPDEETFAMDMQDTEKANRAFQSALNNKDKYDEMGVTLPETVEEFQAIVTTDPKKKSTDTGSNGSQKTQQSSGSKPAQSSTKSFAGSVNYLDQAPKFGEIPGAPKVPGTEGVVPAQKKQPKRTIVRGEEADQVIDESLSFQTPVAESTQPMSFESKYKNVEKLETYADKITSVIETGERTKNFTPKDIESNYNEYAKNALDDYLDYLNFTDQGGSQYQKTKEQLDYYRSLGDKLFNDEQYADDYKRYVDLQQDAILNVNKQDAKYVNKLKTKYDWDTFNKKTSEVELKLSNIENQIKNISSDGGPLTPLEQKKYDDLLKQYNQIQTDYTNFSSELGITQDVINQMSNSASRLAASQKAVNNIENEDNVNSKRLKEYKAQLLSNKKAQEEFYGDKDQAWYEQFGKGLLNAGEQLGSSLIKGSISAVGDLPQILTDAIGIEGYGVTDRLAEAADNINSYVDLVAPQLEDKDFPGFVKASGVIGNGLGSVGTFILAGGGATKAAQGILKTSTAKGLQTASRVGTFTAAASMSSGQMYDQLIEEGFTPEEASRYALAGGLVMGAAEMIVPEDQLLSNSVRRTFIGALRNKSTIKEASEEALKFVYNRSSDVLKNTLKEGGEEAIGQLAQDFSLQSASSLSGKEVDGLWEVQPYVDNFLAGGGVGGVIELLKFGTRNSKYTNRFKESMLLELADNYDDISNKMSQIKPEDFNTIGEKYAKLKNVNNALKDIPGFEDLSHADKSHILALAYNKQVILDSVKQSGLDKSNFDKELTTIEEEIQSTLNKPKDAVQEKKTLSLLKISNDGKLQSNQDFVSKRAQIERGIEDEKKTNYSDQETERRLESTGSWLQAISRGDREKAENKANELLGEYLQKQERRSDLSENNDRGGAEISSQGDNGEISKSETGEMGTRSSQEPKYDGQSNRKSSAIDESGTFQTSYDSETKANEGKDVGISEIKRESVVQKTREMFELPFSKKSSRIARDLQKMLYEATSNKEKNEIINQIKQTFYESISKSSTEEVLPRQQGATTETGGEPQGMGQSVQGEVVAQEGQEVSQEGVKKEETTQVIEKPSDQDAQEYMDNIERSKELDKKKEKPEMWSVSVPSVQDVKEGKVIKDKGGEAVVDKTGEIKGLYKYADSEEKGVGDKLIQKAIEAGGVKLDNFAKPDLMKIYQRNGFRVVSRLPFNTEYAPPGWNEEKHKTPDVVAMVYDPENKLDIQEKQFTKDEYDEALAYRDSFVDAQKEAYGEQKPSQDEETKKKSIADIIRGLKSKGGKLYSAGLGIPVAIWDGAVEIIASAVEAGEGLVNGINKAKKYLQDKLKDRYNEDLVDELLDNVINQSPVEIQSKSLKGDKVKANPEGHNLSFVKPQDLIDIESLIKDIESKNEKVWFWVADQLGRGIYADKTTGNEHFLDAGPSYALDPKNREKGIIWASGMSPAKIEENIKNSDYIFIISGSPVQSKLFNKAVFKLFQDKLGDYKKFKNEVLNAKTTKGIREVLNAHNSWETLIEDPSTDNPKLKKVGTGRKKFLIELLNAFDKPNSGLHQILKSKDSLLDINSIRDGFYADNNFDVNDIMLVLKPEKLGGKSEHSTYENDILGEVIGVPDKKIDAYNILPNYLIKESDTNKTLQTSRVAPYGSGIREVSATEAIERETKSKAEAIRSNKINDAVEMLSDAQESGGTEVTKAQKEVTEKLGEEGKKIAEIDRNFDKLADDLGFIKTCII